MSKNQNDNALAFLRIAVGVFFVIFGEYKVFGTAFTLHGGFESYVTRWVQHGAYPFLVSMLKNVVLEHAHAFAFAVGYGEFLIGVGLVLGILTRWAAFFGLLLMLAMLFSADYPGAGAAFWQYFGASLNHSVFAVCFVAMIFGRADRALAVRGRK
ncbi:MAG TPA: DoxX family protein [Bryobacteraceae bacterium]|nr:DoxX family protein [Bryobacteraceae bacterium]